MISAVAFPYKIPPYECASGRNTMPVTSASHLKQLADSIRVEKAMELESIGPLLADPFEEALPRWKFCQSLTNQKTFQMKDPPSGQNCRSRKAA